MFIQTQEEQYTDRFEQDWKTKQVDEMNATSTLAPIQCEIFFILQ
jgi:hypothetical protein